MRRIWLIVLLLIFSSCNLLNSQMLRIKNLSTRDGLPQNQVTSISQDAKGFLWFRTHGGYSRFDGLDFDNYTMANGLADNTIRYFVEDSINNTYYFLADYSVTVLEKGVFYRFTQEYFRKKFKESIVQTTYYQNNNQSVIYALSKDFLYVYNSTLHEFQAEYNLKNLPERITNTSIIDILNNKIMYLSLEKAIYQVDRVSNKVTYLNKELNLPFANKDVYRVIEIDKNKDNRFIYYNNSEMNKTGFYHWDLKTNTVKKILISAAVTIPVYYDRQNNTWYTHYKDDSYWFLNVDGYVYLYNLQTKKIKRTGLHIDTKRFDITDMKDVILKGTEMWISTSRGLVHFNLKTRETNRYTTANGISSNLINTLTFDRENNLWIGTNGTGVDMVVKGKITNYTQSNGLTTNGVTQMVEGNDGSIWASTDNGVIRIFCNGEIKNYTTANGLWHNDCWGMEKDKDGSIWIGTYQGGLCKFKDNRFVDMRPSILRSYSNYITTIFRDRNDNLWVPYQNYLIKYVNNKPSVITIPKVLSIYRFVQSADGHLWAAAGGEGLIEFDENGKILHEYGDIGTGTLNIVDLSFINKRILWCATYGQGLYVFDIQKKAFVKQYIKEFKNAEILKSMCKDSRGAIWIGTINGVFEYNKMKFYKYTTEDGLVANETRTSGIYKDSQGNLWFGSAFGLMRINPNTEDRDNVAPNIYLKSFTAKKDINIEDSKASHELSYNNNTVSFTFIGIDFRNPKNVLYQYKLVGFDKEWSETTYETKVRYTNLSPGDYTFLVKAIDKWGNVSKETSMNFTIETPYWKTWWFKILIILVLTTFVVCFVKWRTRTLKRRNEELERIVAERTLELREKNEMIMASIRYAERIQHAILPKKGKMELAFEELFIIYKPRDIISGDFYWFATTAEYSFIAAVDCTGHGVPGALLSMIGNMLLNEIVVQNQIIEPSSVLEELHEKVREVLKQKANDSYTMDGMDICLCRIDKINQKIVYAGARRSLYRVIQSDMQLQEIKAGRKTIGGRQREERRVYQQHEFAYEHKEMLYLTTDGYVDQANPVMKKLGARRLKETLIEIASQPAEIQQRKLIELLEKHKSGEPQRDDITIIGIRLS